MKFEFGTVQFGLDYGISNQTVKPKLVKSKGYKEDKGISALQSFETLFR